MGSNPRIATAAALADGVLGALEVGDLGAARAASSALVAYVETLVDDSVLSGATKRLTGSGA